MSERRAVRLLGRHAQLNVISIKMIIYIMVVNKLAKREHVNAEMKGTRERALR